MSTSSKLAIGFVAFLVLAILVGLSTIPNAAKLIQGFLVVLIIAAILGHSQTVLASISTVRKAAGLGG